MLTLSHAAHIVLKAASWRIVDDVFVATATAGLTTGEVRLSSKELGAVDPRLPYALRAIMNEEPYATQGEVPGTRIRLLMNMWLKSAVIRDVDGRKKLVYNITRVTHRQDNDQVILHGSVFDMKTLDIPSLGPLSPVLYFAQYKTDSLTCSKAILNEDLPDGLKRLEAALGLGYSDLEAANNMFTVPVPLHHVDLPPISF